MEANKKLLEMVPKLNIGIYFAQFMLFNINCVFAVVGTLLSVMAFTIDWTNPWYMMLMEADYFKPVVVLITCGAIVFILSFFGSIATIRRSPLIVNIYAVIMLILLLLEIIAAVATFFIHGNIYSSIELNMDDTLKNQTGWNWDYVMQNWNYMQVHLYCCGVHNSKDWAPLHVDGPRIDTNDGFTYTVPYSCCPNIFNNFPSNLSCDDVPLTGCLRALSSYVSYGLVFFWYITLATTISQTLGLIFAFSLSRSIRRLKTEEEMKRQEMQHLIYTDLHKPEEEKPLLTSSSSNT